METVNLGIHDILKIKNAVQSIRTKTDHLGKKYDFRKHGINPLYEDIIGKCNLIEEVLAQQSLENIPQASNHYIIEDIGEEINDNYTTLQKRKKKNAILRNRQTQEWWIPFSLIPAAFNIPGEIKTQDMETFLLDFIFKRNRTKYIHLKVNYPSSR